MASAGRPHTLRTTVAFNGRLPLGFHGLANAITPSRFVNAELPVASFGSSIRDSAHTRWLSSKIANGNTEKRGSSSALPTSPRTVGQDLQELRARQEQGGMGTSDDGVLSVEEASVFPRIKTTSLSTKRIVIHDEAGNAAVTLVLVAFRRYAEEQLSSWRSPFLEACKGKPVQAFDVTINESFASQALSGFVQKLQRWQIDPSLHDYYVAFNSRAREPLEVLLPLDNRLFGYALLLDRNARVRFRASGMATPKHLEKFLRAASALLREDQQRAARL